MNIQILIKNKKKIAVLIIVLLAVILSLVTARRAHKGSNDFDTFYYAGKAIYSDSGIYYNGPYYEKGTEISPFLYSPFAAIFFSLFAWMNLKLAAFLWCVFNFVIIFMCFKICEHLFKCKWKDLLTEKKIDKKFIFFSSIFIFAIVLDNLVMAQMNITVFFVCLYGLFLFCNKQKFLCGFVFSVAILLKMTPALFIIYFVCKKQWKVLVAIFMGLIIFTAIIPSAVFGMEKNRIFHRQWLGRTIKPLYTVIKAKFIEEKDHPRKKSALIIEHDQLTSQLTSKNQALSAMLTRNFLKDRRERGNNPELPIYAAQKYEKLPVWFGGIPEVPLKIVIRSVQILILFVLIFFWIRHRKNANNNLRNGEVALLFLSLTLLAPWARSHQAIAWLYMIAWTISLDMRKCDHVKLLKVGSLLGFILYCLQGLPYGKAIGMGTLANLTLWGAVVVFLQRTFLSLEKEGKGFKEGMTKNLRI